VGKALPFLNAVLGGFTYTKEPPSVSFKSQGKMITVHADKIAVNALRDEAEAKKIVEWLKREINSAWENRDSIEPSYESAPRPAITEIIKLLPKTNCTECGQPTCMVFATQVADGGKGPEDCPPIGEENSKKLSEYMGRFKFDY
jgi:ArsR family metal-binding transcriptional regulator